MTTESGLSIASEKELMPATPADMAAIVAIHQAAFRDSFLTRLGGAFLHQYYEFVLNSDDGILLVSRGRNGVDGFVAGFVRPGDFYRRMKQSGWTFTASVVSGLIRDPSLLARVIYSTVSIGKVAPSYAASGCELSSIAVRPDASGSGIGKQLVSAFVRVAWAKGAQCVHLTTDAHANDAVNGFYRSLGFQVCRRFEQYRGRWMNEYVIQRWPGLGLDESGT